MTEILKSTGSLAFIKIRNVFRGLPDLERGLVRVHFGRAEPAELLKVLQAFERIANVFEKTNIVQDQLKLQSKLLIDVVDALPRIKEPIDGFL